MKILIIDDHAIFRDGLKLVLDSLNTDIKIFEAGSHDSAKDILDTHPDLDLILLDLCLPGTIHLDALSAIRQQTPDSLIVVLSGVEDPHMVQQVLQHGACGYIPKSSPVKIIQHALQLVISGGTYIPPQILQNSDIELDCSFKDSNPNHRLTPRQNEVLRELAKGKSNKAIASALNLTESTVRAHVAAILKSFNASNRTQAVQYATQNGLLTTNLS